LRPRCVSPSIFRANASVEIELGVSFAPGLWVESQEFDGISAMKTKKQYEFISRDSILKILSDEEVARVGMTKTASKLAEGDEFIDLMQIELGVQRAGASSQLPDVLPRKAVHENTWRKVVTNLTAWKAMTQTYTRPSRQP
jgi:hypothetical protein